MVDREHARLLIILGNDPSASLGKKPPDPRIAGERGAAVAIDPSKILSSWLVMRL